MTGEMRRRGVAKDPGSPSLALGLVPSLMCVWRMKRGGGRGTVMRESGGE